MSRDEQEEFEKPCDDPCSPYYDDGQCEHCAMYWQRMRDEGFWVDGRGWTDKAMREWSK